MGSIGNGLIAKQIIYQTTQLLKINKPEDILVGIMWSGIDRHEIYTLSKEAKKYVETDGLIENPTEVVPRKSIGVLCIQHRLIQWLKYIINIYIPM